MDVELEYGVLCGHLDRTPHRTAHRLLDTQVWDAADHGCVLDANNDEIAQRLAA
ncbi:hypothetical protein [Salsipaludibacter albus]|uniref:hypothetical protein n=1 Tax=Salsipaludibacter albus TaxID=2849650 RepID=UPI001EE4931A|nr:hypothetical protein [Salsipaludibacter albus]MBY5162664.1 hypothetical protein [Salsipaludibacter albus]